MITKKGVLLALAGALAVVIGLLSGRLGLVGLGIALLAYLAVGYLHAPRSVLDGTLRLSQDRLREDDDFTVEARMSAGRDRTGLVEVHVALPGVTRLARGEPLDLTALRPGAEHRLSFDAAIGVRGVYGIGPLEVRAQDPFLLYAREWELASAASLTVYPRWRVAKELPIRGKTPRPLAGRYVVHQPGDGLDFFGLREYLPGDPLRAVNWKATARARELIVNQWERESVTEATIFLDARRVAGLGTEIENPLLHETRIAATLVAYFLGARDTVRVVLYADTVRTHRGGRGEGHFHSILQDLASIQPKDGTTLGHAVDLTLPHIRPKSPVVVLTPALGDPSLGDALSRLLAQGNPLFVFAPRPILGDGAGAAALAAAYAKGVDAARSAGAVTYEVANQDEALDLLMEAPLQ